MVKKKVQKSTKEELKDVLHEVNTEYCNKWKAVYAKHGSVIIPFIVGIVDYLGTLIFGSLTYIAKLVWFGGKVLWKALVKSIKE